MSAKVIYFVPNPVTPALLARSMNKARAAGKDPLTGDADISRRRWKNDTQDYVEIRKESYRLSNSVGGKGLEPLTPSV